MQNALSELEFENQWLKQVISLAEEQLNQAKLRNEDNSESIIALKQEARENTVHSVSGLWNSQNFEDLVELSQFATQIENRIASFDVTANEITKLERLIHSPYFARIDFKFDPEDGFEKVYIGRSSLTKEDPFEIVVYDWRSPIASVFYRFGVGRAFYEAPNGKITGEVNLKRQYEISKGILEYFFDADVQILDEFLRKLLSQNTSPKMKTIVETIQKEQDILIRDMENDLMMVQGVAGSGKTSIALHRAAYLMYLGLSANLSADHIVIISPNALFEQYISNVLPELGEDNVVSVIFEEILVKILKNERMQTRNQFLESLITKARDREITKSSMTFKTSHLFLEIINRFMDEESAQSNAIDLYRKLFSDKAYFYCLSKDLDLPDCIEEILTFTEENLRGKFLYYDDAAALAFLSLKINEVNEYRNIKQVIIDEAQDYYPLHYEILNLLFPNAKYTVLGDINQTLEKREDLSLYEQINKIFKRKKSTLVTMDKSFRCTNEILTYSSKFIEQCMQIKSFNRKGDEPEIHTAADLSSLGKLIVSEVKCCLEKGYGSIGLICKTEKNAVSLFEQLKDLIDVQLIKNDCTASLQGIFVIPVYMSKGLEFDAVLICDAGSENYHREDDKKLLYIACTRALHRLNLFCTGEPSPFI